MALAFHRDGNKLFVTVTSPDKNNTAVIEVERTLADGTVQKNPIAYERYSQDIASYNDEQSTAHAGNLTHTARRGAPHGSLIGGNLTNADPRDDAPHGNVTHRRGR